MCFYGEGYKQMFKNQSLKKIFRAHSILIWEYAFKSLPQRCSVLLFCLFQWQRMYPYTIFRHALNQTFVLRRGRAISLLCSPESSLGKEIFCSSKIVTIQWCSQESLSWELSLNLSGEQCSPAILRDEALAHNKCNFHLIPFPPLAKIQPTWT